MLGSLGPGRSSPWLGLALARAILLPFGYLAFKVVSPLLTRVARPKNQELFLLVALAIALGAAAVTQAIGLSLALGAFLAGLLDQRVRLRPRDAGPPAVPSRRLRRPLLRDHRGPHRPGAIATNLPLLGAMVVW